MILSHTPKSPRRFLKLNVKVTTQNGTVEIQSKDSHYVPLASNRVQQPLGEERPCFARQLKGLLHDVFRFRAHDSMIRVFNPGGKGFQALAGVTSWAAVGDLQS